MSVTIELAGGPADGQTFSVSDDQPPFLWRVPLPASVADLVRASLDPAPIRVAEYEPLLEGGQLRRTEGGAYVYGYRVPPVTAETRQAVEDARRKARAAEQVRRREMDEAWAEICEVRPHFPPDWRDLFGG